MQQDERLPTASRNDVDQTSVIHLDVLVDDVRWQEETFSIHVVRGRGGTRLTSRLWAAQPAASAAPAPEPPMPAKRRLRLLIMCVPGSCACSHALLLGPALACAPCPVDQNSRHPWPYAAQHLVADRAESILPNRTHRGGLPLTADEHHFVADGDATSRPQSRMIWSIVTVPARGRR